MLGKQGHLVAEVNSDEILGEELVFLNIYEQAGLGLPMAKIHFYTQDENKVKRYNEPGYKVQLGLGVDTVDSVSPFVVFTRKIAQTAGADNWSVVADLVYDAVPYLTTQRFRHFDTHSDKKKSSDVWARVVEEANFRPETQASDDKMLWLQTNSTDRQFLEELTWHAYFGADDPALSALLADGRAIFKPYSALRSSKGCIGTTPDATFRSNDFSLSQNEGFLTGWSGSKRRVPHHNAESGLDELDIGDVQAKIATASGSILGVERTQEIEFLNDNVHPKWWDAYRLNRQFRASMSSTRITLNVDGYGKISPLDTYEVKLERQSDSQLLIQYNGDWLVESVTSSIQKSTVMQHLSLCREVLL